MNPAVSLKEKVENVFRQSPYATAEETSRPPRILVATTDPEIRKGLTELLQGFSFDVIWLKSVDAAKSLLSKEKIAACFCGFWLQDGTYRQLVRHIRRVRMDIPVIILSGPACPSEYNDILSAINLGAVDFLSYPYSKSDLKRMINLSIDVSGRTAGGQSALIAPDTYAGEAA